MRDVASHTAKSSSLPGSWIREAACRGVPDRVFFPERGDSVVIAKAMCRRCPVREECLSFALDTGQDFGVWAGTSPKERRRIRRSRRLDAAGRYQSTA